VEYKVRLAAVLHQAYALVKAILVRVARINQPAPAAVALAALPLTRPAAPFDVGKWCGSLKAPAATASFTPPPDLMT
jgi:hypothetical protein